MFKEWDGVIARVPQGSFFRILPFKNFIKNIFLHIVNLYLCNDADDSTFYASCGSLSMIMEKVIADYISISNWFHENSWDCLWYLVTSNPNYTWNLACNEMIIKYIKEEKAQGVKNWW